MATAAILDLFEPEIVLFDPPSPKTPPHRTKHKVYRITRRGDWPFAYILWAYGTHILEEREVLGVNDGTIRKSDGGFL